VLAGRQSTTAYSSLDAQLVTDTIYASIDGEMNVSPIVVSDTMTFDAIEGILFYGFSNYRLIPRNNNDFIGANLTLDSVYVPTSPLSIVELDQRPLTYYPNPVSDVLTITSEQQGTLEMYNAAGRRIFTTTFNNEAIVNTSALPNGLYILRLRTEQGLQTARIFVQH
jgi:hypothetical protein